MSGPQPPPASGDERARILRRALPGVAHRLGNVLIGTRMLCENLPGPDGEGVQERLELLGDTLKRLTLLAYEPAAGECTFEVHELIHGLRLLLPGEELELRASGKGAFQADARLEERLLGACLDLAGSGRRPRRLRLSLRAFGGTIRLCIVAAEAPPVEAFGRVTGYAHERGWPSRTHALGRARACAWRIPALSGARGECDGLPAARTHSVLLLAEPDEDRALVVEVLRERGHHVLPAERVPGTGSFSLVLVRRTLLAADPGLPARVARAHAAARVHLVEARMNPQALFELL